MESLSNIFIPELIETLILIFLGGGVCANIALKNTKGNNSGLIIIASGWAFAVFVACLVSIKSGTHLNPAVTIGLAIKGTIQWGVVATYIIAQMIGAILGAILVYINYKDHFDITSDTDTKKGVFCTAPAIKNTSLNLFSEIIGTFILVFAVLNIFRGFLNIERLTSEFGLGSLGSIPVALVILSIGVSLGKTTWYAINPARDLKPRIAHAILPIKGKESSDW